MVTVTVTVTLALTLAVTHTHTHTYTLGVRSVCTDHLYLLFCLSYQSIVLLTGLL